MVQKILSGQIFINISNLHCDLDLEHSHQVFFCRAVWLMMLYYQTKFGCKRTSGLEDIVEIVLFWLYKPSLWPWHWTQWTNFSAWHSGLWHCITIPGLVTKCPVVQKISRQTFTNILNLRCDLDFNAIIQFFHSTLRLISNKIWLQTDQKFRGYSKNSHILTI